jgi:hypothetical protein
MIALMQPLLGAVNEQSRLVSGKSIIAGTSEVLNSLAPGSSIRIFFPADGYPSQIYLNGHEISTVIDGETIYGDCRWALPSSALYAGNAYDFVLVNNRVQVTLSG